jgi:hypothetical protein
VDSSESLHSDSGLGSVLVLGLFSLYLVYALKNEKDHLLVIFFPKHSKKKKIIAFSYAFMFGSCSIGCLLQKKRVLFQSSFFVISLKV